MGNILLAIMPIDFNFCTNIIQKVIFSTKIVYNILLVISH